MSVEKYDKQQLADMSDEKLVHAELQLDRDLVTLRFQKRAGNGKNIHKLKQARRAIARLKTEQTAREKAAGLAKGAFHAQYKESFQPLDGDLETESSFMADLNEQMED